jgi:CheY-like chemotaxis protein
MTDAPLAKLLVVDDSTTVLRVMEGILSQAGYDVTCLDSGREVVEVARSMRPDLIFVDFAMPDVTGYGVCHALGNTPELETTPIVVMNTRGDTVGDRFIRELGIVDHITNPLAPAVLLAVVEHTLEKACGKEPQTRRTPIPLTRRTERDASNPAQARRALASLLAAELDAEDDLVDKLERVLDLSHVREAVTKLSSVEASRHPLHGQLAVVPVAEVMQVLSLQRQSGFLHVQHGEPRVSIAFKDGSVRLTTGANLPPEFLLGNILVQEKLIPPEDLELFLTNRRGTSQRLGAQVVKLGYLKQKDLHRALRRQSSELVYELLRWSRGEFWFECCDELPKDVLEFEFDLTIDELLMEGFRRVDEWGLVESVIPSFDGVPCRTPVSLDHLGPAGLTEDEQKILTAVDGRRNVHAIIREVTASSFDVARILYRLVSSRVVAMQLQIPPVELTIDDTVT